MIDSNPNPTREETAYAIRNNICRCTGYKKIIDGIMLAAQMLRENLPIPEDTSSWKIGERVARLDVREKVLGTGEYTDDMEVNGMVYASAVRSAYPRAIVKAIRMEKALEADGILAIYTADDIPGSVKTGHLKQDWDAMIPIGKITHYLGDAICLVVGETREAVEAAKGVVNRWMAAPELEGGMAFGRALRAAGITGCMGHSNVTFAQVEEAMRNGYSCVVHLYSVMSTVTRDMGFRRGGLVEAGLLLDDLDVEIICDGCHLPPELIRLAVKCKGYDRLMLVSDCGPLGGFPDGEYEADFGMAKLKVFIEDGVGGNSFCFFLYHMEKEEKSQSICGGIKSFTELLYFIPRMFPFWTYSADKIQSSSRRNRNPQAFYQ